MKAQVLIAACVHAWASVAAAQARPPVEPTTEPVAAPRDVSGLRWYGEPGCDPAPPPVPRSIGAASDGRLEDGQTFPNVPGAAALKSHAFGTVETVAYLLLAIDQVRAAFPSTPPLAIGHLSRKGGGRLRPHRSHHSGRDVDAGYYHLKGSSPPRWQLASRDNLDVPRSWALFDALLKTGRVRFLFVDYGLQALLYAHAKKLGVPAARLSAIFQYPRGKRVRVGLIRHERGHRDHFHVRFACPVGETDCRP